MKFRMPSWSQLISLIAVLVASLFPATLASAESVPLERAIRLALSHSTTSTIANADVQHSIAGYRELRNNFIPQLAAGSGLGWSYGFPLTIEGSAPSLVTVAAQSSVFNAAQNQYLGAARADIRAFQFQEKDQRNAVIQDVVLTYAELAKWEARLVRLREDEAQAQQMERAVSERLQEGVDSATDLNKAKLVTARVRLHRTEATGSADVLRRHLATLTGLPVSTIEIEAGSVPALPPVASQNETAEKAADSSPVVKFSEQHSLAESMRALAEHRTWLPSLDFSAQYSRFATQLNNYTTYYPHIQPNNATIGVAIRFQFFNASQRARAEGADAEALKAKKQAEAARNQVSEETLKLQRAAEQLAAARDVAQLEYQLAQSGFEAAQTRIDAKTGTLHELADARVQANERYLLFQDSEFEYQRVRLNLLRATGELETWALPGGTATGLTLK
jgi:outer membrane protein TolC